MDVPHASGFAFIDQTIHTFQLLVHCLSSREALTGFTNLVRIIGMLSGPTALPYHLLLQKLFVDYGRR